MVEFHVLRCSDCSTFQVLQVSKTNKWKCKLCGQKQSILKVYGVGTGAECRKHVQKLNCLRGELHLAGEEKALVSIQRQLVDKEEKHFTLPSPKKLVGAMSQSRWSKYADIHAENAGDENKEDLEHIKPAVEDAIKVTTDWTEYREGMKRKKQWSNHSRTDANWTESFHASRSRRIPHNKSRKTSAKQSSFIHGQCDEIYCTPSDDSDRLISAPLSLKHVDQCQFGDGLCSSFSEVNGTETRTNFCSYSLGSQIVDETDELQRAKFSEDNHSLLTSQQRKNITKKGICDNNKKSASSKWGMFLEEADGGESDESVDRDADGKLIVRFSSDSAAKVTRNGNGNLNTDKIDELSSSKISGNFIEKGYHFKPALDPFVSTCQRLAVSNNEESSQTKGFNARSKSPACKFTSFPGGPSAIRKVEPHEDRVKSSISDVKKPVFDLKYDLDDNDFDL